MTARADRPGLVSGKKDKARTKFLLTMNRKGEKGVIVAVPLGTVLEVSVDTNLVPVLALLEETNFSPRMQTFRGVCVAVYCALLNVIAHYRTLSRHWVGGMAYLCRSRSGGGRSGSLRGKIRNLQPKAMDVGKCSLTDWTFRVGVEGTEKSFACTVVAPSGWRKTTVQAKGAGRLNADGEARGYSRHSSKSRASCSLSKC